MNLVTPKAGAKRSTNWPNNIFGHGWSVLEYRHLWHLYRLPAF
jgi:hypothetical protein